MAPLTGNEIPARQPLIHMSEQLRHTPLNFDDIIIHSRLRDFEKSVTDSGLSIKLGHIGTERYLFKNQQVSLQRGSYLLVNRHQTFDCFIRNPTPVEGFCFYLSPRLIQEAASGLSRSVEDLLDHPAPKSNNKAPHFLEKIYRTDENKLGRYLEQLRPALVAHEQLDFNQVFFDVATALLRTHWRTEQEMRGIDCTRRSTREELYRRLCAARQFIFDNYCNDIQLEELAKAALLSKFHLLRTYKQAFGITPYQQVLELRLHKASRLVQEGGNLSHVASELGFSDRRSFTKAFKKKFGVAPSYYRAG
ncbi:MAG: AraC family transcriptional regulator [Phaeodactylibacter sp.]|uniref:helix-turn-helix transcriptional regulator n=1 Tax=Phaeodactylibacter sp. TaxID=1940289 RepID=UPI0032F07724